MHGRVIVRILDAHPVDPSKLLSSLLPRSPRHREEKKSLAMTMPMFGPWEAHCTARRLNSGLFWSIDTKLAVKIRTGDVLDSMNKPALQLIPYCYS
jgi:hypothetical protein